MHRRSINQVDLNRVTRETADRLKQSFASSQPVSMNLIVYSLVKKHGNKGGTVIQDGVAKATPKMFAEAADQASLKITVDWPLVSTGRLPDDESPPLGGLIDGEPWQISHIAARTGQMVCPLLAPSPPLRIILPCLARRCGTPVHQNNLQKFISISAHTGNFPNKR